MATSSIPPELWIEIGTHITTTSDLVKLLLVNRSFSQLFLPGLYSAISIIFKDMDIIPELAPNSNMLASCDAMADTPAGKLLRRLEENPKLQGYVQTCSIIGLKAPGGYYTKDIEWVVDVREYNKHYHGAVIGLIAQFP